jgi:hypothetical protein
VNIAFDEDYQLKMCIFEYAAMKFCAGDIVIRILYTEGKWD